LASLKRVEGGYPKIRGLQKLLRPHLDPFKINMILRYLERSKRLETDLDGNIIWIREDNNNTNQLSLAEGANLSKEFLDFFYKKDTSKDNLNIDNHSSEKEDEIENTKLRNE
jgi:hypothetical protein